MGYVVDPYRDKKMAIFRCRICGRTVPFALWLKIFDIHRREHRKIGPRKRVGLTSEADN